MKELFSSITSLEKVIFCDISEGKIEHAKKEVSKCFSGPKFENSERVKR